MMKNTKVKVVFVAIVLMARLAESSLPVYGATPDDIEVSFATSKDTYLLGEDIVITATAHNPNPEPVTRLFPCWMGYITYSIDGLPDPVLEEEKKHPHALVLDGEITIDPYESLTWRLKHDDDDKTTRPTGVGTHVAVVESIFGTSGPLIFKVVSGIEYPKGNDFTRIQEDANYEPNEILIKFRPKQNGQKQSETEKSQILNSLGGGTIISSTRNIVPGLSRVKLPDGMTVEEAMKTFNNVGGIDFAQPNYEYSISSTMPNDTSFGSLWGMHNTGQTGGDNDADIDAPEAWDIATDSDIIVAVIDSGVDYNHPDLMDNMWVNEAELNGDPDVDDDNNGYVDDIYGYDFCTRGDEQTDPDPMDDQFHGTHVSGTIGATGNNNQGVTGVCWDVKIMALKFLDSSGKGRISDAIDCIDYAIENGAKILNNSWGNITFDAALYWAIYDTMTEGMLFIAAAGNSGSNNDVYPVYPASYAWDNIISVLATDDEDDRVWGSNYGQTTVDLGAPGENILSTFPTYETFNMIYYWDNSEEEWIERDPHLSTYCETISGTSMAAPHVAGACALTWSEYPDLSWQEVKDRILNNVDHVLFYSDCVAGGRLNLNNALIPSQLAYNTNRDKWSATIQGAISDPLTVNGDTIMVYPGTYQERIDFEGKAITLTSTDPDDWNVVEDTIIDAGGAGIAVSFTSGEGNNSVLTGLTVRNGGYGIYCLNSPATISKCNVEDNITYGVYCYNSDAAISDCAITNTTAYDGMYFYNSDLTISNCIIEHNNRMGIYSYYSDATISDCDIEDNNYYGIYCVLGSPVISRNRIGENVIGASGMGVFLNATTEAVVTNNWIYNNSYGLRTHLAYTAEARNNTIVGNTYYGIYATGVAPTVSNCIVWDNSDDLFNCTATYSCIEDGDAGQGNISTDPDFVNASNDDYHLESGSPCIDEGNTALVGIGELDIDGQDRVMNGDVDMGADEHNP